MTLHFLNNVASDAGSTQNRNLRQSVGKLISRIPGSCLLISSLQDLALRMLVDITISTSILKALPGKLDIKRHEPSIFFS